jgi:hypothetical protein
LKALAREINAPVVVLCQLSREAEQQPDGYRMLSTLRESGDIEQDADVVMILHRLSAEKLKAYEDKHGEGSAGKFIQVTVAKHRNGPTGMVNLLFDKKQQRFCMLARQYDQGETRPVEPKRNKPLSFFNTTKEEIAPQPQEPEQYDLTPVAEGEYDEVPF